MKRANVRRGAGYRNPKRSELVAGVIQEGGIGRKTTLLG